MPFHRSFKIVSFAVRCFGNLDMFRNFGTFELLGNIGNFGNFGVDIYRLMTTASANNAWPPNLARKHLVGISFTTRSPKKPFRFIQRIQSHNSERRAIVTGACELNSLRPKPSPFDVFTFRDEG